MEKLNQKTIVQFIVNEIFKDTEALKSWIINHGYQISNSSVSLFNNSSNGYDLSSQIDSQETQTTKTIFNNNSIQKLPIKLGNKILFININLIKYIEASGYYAEIHTNKKEYLLRESLSNLIVKLSNTGFIRIHRSTLINLEYMQELVHSNYNEIDVKMIDGKLFRISKSYKKELFVKLGL